MPNCRWQLSTYLRVFVKTSIDLECRCVSIALLYSCCLVAAISLVHLIHSVCARCN